MSMSDAVPMGRMRDRLPAHMPTSSLDASAALCSSERGVSQSRGLNVPVKGGYQRILTSNDIPTVVRGLDIDTGSGRA
jgi:hypothetical protein